MQHLLEHALKLETIVLNEPSPEREDSSVRKEDKTLAKGKRQSRNVRFL